MKARRLTRTQSAISLIMLTALLGVVAIPVSGIFYDPWSKLTKVPTGGNYEFHQKREPTEDEKLAGKRALTNWRSSDDKHRLAAEIVLGKALIGLTQKEIVSFMGQPDGFGASNDVGPQIRHTGYSCLSPGPFGESVCDLLIDLDDSGKTYDAYLDVNY